MFTVANNAGVFRYFTFTLAPIFFRHVSSWALILPSTPITLSITSNILMTTTYEIPTSDRRSYLFSLLSHWSCCHRGILCRLPCIFFLYYSPQQCSVSDVWWGDCSESLHPTGFFHSYSQWFLSELSHTTSLFLVGRDFHRTPTRSFLPHFHGIFCNRIVPILDIR